MENWRIRDPVSGISRYNSISIAQWHVKMFGNKVLQRLHALPWGRDAFFHHERKGLKTTNFHDPGDAFARNEAYSAFMDGFDEHLMQPEEWLIDIALTFSWCDANGNFGDALLWRKDYHAHILAHLLNIRIENALEIIKGRNHKTDTVAHLTNIAGFRTIVPRKIAEEEYAFYVNCYTTDKIPVAFRNRGFYTKRTTFRSMVECCRKNQEFTYPGAAIEAYSRCLEERYPVNARLEVRMSSWKGLDHLVELSEDILTDGLVHFKGPDFW
jgi:hypothetical protein